MSREWGRQIRAMPNARQAWTDSWRLIRQGKVPLDDVMMGYKARHCLGSRDGTWPIATDRPFWRLLGLIRTEGRYMGGYLSTEMAKS